VVLQVPFPFLWNHALSQILCVFFDHLEAEEGTQVIDAVAEVTERRDPMHAVSFGMNVLKKFVGIN
jgi:hypothetical protein